MLSNKQRLIQKKLEEAFYPGSESFIHLHGPSGAGKTTLVKEYIGSVNDKFQDWIVYYIDGKRNPVEAYSTITLSDELNRPKHEISSFTLNLGFRISEFFTIGVAGVFQKKPELDPKVNFVIEELRKSQESNILIVADSFQYWDKSSQKFLFTLKNFHRKLLGYKTLRILIISDDNLSESPDYIDLQTLSRDGEELILKLPVKDELREYLSLLGYPALRITEDDLEIIMSITGGHLEYIKLFIEGYYYSKQGKLSTETSLIDVMKMLDYRLERFGDKKKNFSDVLQVSSILNGDFKAEQIKYLFGDRADIDDVLKESCENSILKEGNHYIFTNVFIQDLFYKKLKTNNSNFKYEIEYAKYLKEQEPENYTARAYYVLSGDYNNEHIYEIIELFALAYCRNVESSTEDAEAKRIHELLKEKVDLCGDKHEVRTQYNNFLYLKESYSLYFQEKYDEASDELNKTTLSGPPLLMSEINRMKLVIALMLDMNTENIRSLATRLNESLPILKINEKEQWCKSAFTLFSTFSNKLDDYEQSKKIVEELLSFINLNYNNALFEYIGKIISRKACVYESAVMSKTYTQDSVIYFAERNDFLQYYLALCNHSGNLIIVGDYDKAILNLTRCLELVEEHRLLAFPSLEKIHNNLILANFMKNYSEMDSLDEKIINEAIEGFERAISFKPRESNAIMCINIINLYAMKRDYNMCYKILYILENDILVNNNDSFYRYYIANINLSINILKQSWEEAGQFLKELLSNFPNFHKKNEKKIHNRNEALTLLVKNKICLNPDELDEWVHKNTKRLDDACGFYNRLFLFSDLQFTSI